MSASGLADEKPYSRARVAALFFFPALGGLLFGYDIGATSYSVPQMMSEQYSGVEWHNAVADSTALQGAITSAGVGGALIGSVAVFRITERLGTRREMLIAAVLFAVGAAIEYLGGHASWSAGPGLAVLMCGRWTYGIGCGFAMHGAPSYIAELSPPDIRGALVSLKEGMIVLGILTGYLIGYCLSRTFGGWRFTYAAAMLPAVVMFLGVWQLPSPPRWILAGRKGGTSEEDEKRAAASLRFVYPTVTEATLRQMLRDIDNSRGAKPSAPSYSSPPPSDEGGGLLLSPLLEREVPEIIGGIQAPEISGGSRSAGSNAAERGSGGAASCASAATEGAVIGGSEEGVASIFTAQNRRALVAGLGIVTLQQVTGQPSILYYASSIFEDAGLASYAAVLTGAFKLLATMVSVVLVDRYGRRWLLFVGVSAMLLALSVMVVAFWVNGDGGGGGDGTNGATVAIILGMFVYIGGYQISFGPIAWLLISEIFPLDVRDRAISIAVFTNFAWNLVVTFLYPIIVKGLGALLGEENKLAAAFSIFLVLTIYSLHFINRNVPETKGMTLLEIQTFLRNLSSFDVSLGDMT